MMAVLTRAESAARYGPTTGDSVRLADTSLWVRVGADYQATGDEPVLGYAKNLRHRMAQEGTAGPSELDVVVAGAVVVDPVLGVLKADIGIKDGRIVGVGTAGSREISDSIDLVIGPHTRPIMGYGLIATPGAVDSHVHLVSPALIPAALSAGITTLVTGGFEEPPWAMERTLLALDGWPLNVGLQACARAEDPAALESLIRAGAVGFKIHEDYGAYPELIDFVLRFADQHDVAVALHTDGLHESGELEDTVAAIDGRTVHAYHVEGTGGGHVPDLIGLVREPNIICSSTTPTVPYGVAAPDEHLSMALLVHLGSWDVANDVAVVRERIHPATMAAEGPLHELGAISIINSDSQGMGRIMESVRRTFQLADVMKGWRTSPEGSGHAGLPTMGTDYDDNERVLQYLAKITIEPAITHGISDHVGSLQPGRLADLVLWNPAFFAAKPEVVIKSGMPVWGNIGEGNASVQKAEPTRYRSDFGGAAAVATRLGVTFATPQAIRDGTVAHPNRTVVPVRGCRGLSRSDLARNTATAMIDVDPGNGQVSLGGRPLAARPVDDLPLNRRYFLR